ncbi:hypothetical protein ACFQZ4_30040 [Catellatospora coxensis]|uniref:Uncharacterized protein n=1 Tax=Catellatospora coxensis TaxID=310354 RepID=A0A8J3PBX6_9ACTN|nr:hypothetical protein [Catellatospora coxensis]GIG10818.1 hypothetical protein Cco03nite_75180 [Catellatospora coxensis]
MKRTLLAAALAAAAILSTASPAAAADDAYNLKTQVLSSSPTDSMATSCFSRHIVVDDGTAAQAYDWYAWGGYFGGSIAEARIILLADGGYTWKDCLDPRGPNGTYTHGYYHHTSTLDPDAAGLDTATYVRDFSISTTKEWTWGSYLWPDV